MRVRRSPNVKSQREKNVIVDLGSYGYGVGRGILSSPFHDLVSQYPY